MKKISGLMVAAMAALYASNEGGPRGNGEFASRLDTMRFSDLSRYTHDKLSAFEADLNREKGSDPYLNGRGAYKAKVDAWAAAVNDAKIGSFRQDSDAIPERVRPVDGRCVINMFEVTESQLRDNPDAARRFYRELQDIKQSQSYKDQPRTKAQADKWISWLEDNGFGSSEGGVGLGGANPPAARSGSNPPRAELFNYVDDGSRQRAEDDRRRRAKEAEDRRRQQEEIFREQQRLDAIALDAKKKEDEARKKRIELANQQSYYSSRKQYNYN